MTRIGRRTVLIGLATSVGAPAILRAQSLFTQNPFSLGIASGDPAPDGFVIWTRLAPKPLELHSGMPMVTAPVTYEVAEDENFNTIVANGETQARPELGHSVHVEITGLKPASPYWYRFIAGRERSATGRARTMPHPGSGLDRVRFVAAGCQNYENGFYAAYRGIAGEELDFLWHYGDYIYEGQTKAGIRQHVGEEPYSLDDYRLRYAQYKMDADLQAAHAAHSWWVTWDDHETDNNWAGDRGQDGTPPAIFNLRRQAAAQAYYENMPLRATSFPHGPSVQIYRQAKYGDLLDAHFLDTRQYRMDQPCGDGFKPACAAALTSDRSILGAVEEKWLFEGLAKSPSRWKLIANQVMIMPLDRRTGNEPAPIWNMDSWAGYSANRTRLLNHIQKNKVKNVIVTTGDEHQNYAAELRGPKGDALGIEFVATSISTGGNGSDMRPGNDRIMANNPHLKFTNDQRGYILCEARREAWTTELKVLDRVDKPEGALSVRRKFTVPAGESKLT